MTFQVIKVVITALNTQEDLKETYKYKDMIKSFKDEFKKI